MRKTYTEDLLKDEYAVFYSQYIKQAPIGNIEQSLLISHQQMLELWKSIPSDKYEYRYAPEKWSIKEVFQHIMDTERVFTYRALRFARQDNTDLPGFDQDHFADYSYADLRNFQEMLTEYQYLRKSTIGLFGSFPHKTMATKGAANQSIMTVRAAGFIIAGHEQHHARIIRERYLV